MTPLWHHDACSSLLGMRERFTYWTRVPYLWLKKKGGERGKEASALGWNMDTQTLSHFAHIQTKGAAYSTFHWSKIYCFCILKHTVLSYVGPQLWESDKWVGSKQKKLYRSCDNRSHLGIRLVSLFFLFPARCHIVVVIKYKLEWV